MWEETQRQKHSQGEEQGGKWRWGKWVFEQKRVDDAFMMSVKETFSLWLHLPPPPRIAFFFVSSLDEMLHGHHDNASAGQRRVDFFFSGITTARCGQRLSWGCLWRKRGRSLITGEEIINNSSLILINNTFIYSAVSTATSGKYTGKTPPFSISVF